MGRDQYGDESIGRQSTFSRHRIGIAAVRPDDMTLRRRPALILTVLVVVTAAIAAVVVAGDMLRGARETSANIWDRASLPEHLQICGRSYRHDTLDRIRTAAEIEEFQGYPPTVVLPLQVQPCIPGPCDDVADSAPCDTVVYVRVGADAYVDYSLQGGP